jgi:transketolase
VGGGLAYGNLGYSHHAIQDFALMRSFPNMVIAAPGDPSEVRGAMDYLIELGKPAYLRLGKSGEPLFHNKDPKMAMGQWLHVSGDPTSKKAILSTGANLVRARKMVSTLRYKDYAVYSMPIWGKSGKAAQPKMLQKFSDLTVVEDHLIDGGFGSWILESANAGGIDSSRIELACLSDQVLGRVGTQDFLSSLVSGEKTFHGSR